MKSNKMKYTKQTKKYEKSITHNHTYQKICRQLKNSFKVTRWSDHLNALSVLKSTEVGKLFHTLTKRWAKKDETHSTRAKLFI